MSIFSDLADLDVGDAPTGPDGQPLVLDGWVVTRLIGKGSMSLVFEARREGAVNARPVAIKLVRPSAYYAAAAEGTAVRFPRHENLLTLHEERTHVHIRADGAVPVRYLVMDLLEGRTGDTLTAELRRPGTLLPVLVDLARGLEFLHAQGFLHRDLKPSNVFIEQVPGQRPRGKLTDFGLLRDDAEAAGDASTGAHHGTTPYQAPERYALDRPERRSSSRTDVFAFGLTLAHLATGRHVFADVAAIRSSGAQVARMAVAVQEVEKRIAALVPALDDIAPGLGAVVADCTRRDPSARPADGGAVRVRLESLVPRIDTAVVAPSPTGPRGMGRQAEVTPLPAAQSVPLILRSDRPPAPPTLEEIYAPPRRTLGSIFLLSAVGWWCGGIAGWALVDPWWSMSDIGTHQFNDSLEFVMFFGLTYAAAHTWHTYRRAVRNRRVARPRLPVHVLWSAFPFGTLAALGASGFLFHDADEWLTPLARTTYSLAIWLGIGPLLVHMLATRVDRAIVRLGPDSTVHDREARTGRIVPAVLALSVIVMALLLYLRSTYDQAVITDEIQQQRREAEKASRAQEQMEEKSRRAAVVRILGYMRAVPGTGAEGAMVAVAGISDPDQPQRRVIVEPFQAMDREATYADWVAVMGEKFAGGHRVEANRFDQVASEKADELPVVFVNWCEAAMFANRLTESVNLSNMPDDQGRLVQTQVRLTPAYHIPSEIGKDDGSCEEWADRIALVLGATGFRLPSEAEWLWMAQVGVGEFAREKRPCGTKTPGWFSDTIGFYGVYARPQRACTLPCSARNAYGLCDVFGNVSEWASDRWLPSVPDGTRSGRLVLGGGWQTPREGMGVGAVEDPGYGSETIGFRLVRSMSGPTSSWPGATETPTPGSQPR